MNAGDEIADDSTGDESRTEHCTRNVATTEGSSTMVTAAVAAPDNHCGGVVKVLERKLDETIYKCIKNYLIFESHEGSYNGSRIRCEVVKLMSEFLNTGSELVAENEMLCYHE